MTGYLKKLSKIITLMEQKEVLARRILILTRRQRDTLLSATPGDMSLLSNLQDLLDERQILIDKVDAIDKQIELLNNCDHTQHGDKGSPLIETIKNLEKKIKNVFYETQKIEVNNSNKLKEIKLDLSTHIKSLRAAKNKSGIYNKLPGQVQGFFIDKKK